jgi:hypothetical protein
MATGVEPFDSLTTRARLRRSRFGSVRKIKGIPLCLTRKSCLTHIPSFGIDVFDATKSGGSPWVHGLAKQEHGVTPQLVPPCMALVKQDSQVTTDLMRP